MPRIHYAIEVETESTVSSATYGITAGFFRFVTDRPVYEGGATGGSIIPTGENCAFTIALGGTETIGESFQSGGEIYAASNSTFKAANTVPTVGMRFTVGDDVDFSGGQLATAKGSASGEGDMFEVTNATSGSEAVRYVGVNRWYVDMITRDGMSNPSRSVDLELSGDYGTLSGFTFSVNGAIVAGTDTPLWSYIAAQSVALANKPVRLYAVIDDVFRQIWTGIVDRTNINETEFIFECKSNFKAVHRDLPPVTDLDGNTTPVCIGDIEYVKAIDAETDAEYLDLVVDVFESFKIAQATAYLADATGTYITLKTTGVSFTEDELIDRYMFVANGGGSPDTEYGYRIIGNDATSSGSTKIYLAESIEDAFVLTTYGYNCIPASNAWNFKIGKITVEAQFSNAAVTSVKRNSDGDVLLYRYSEESKEYEQLDYCLDSFNLTTAKIQYISPRLSESGQIKVLLPHVPALIADNKTPASKRSGNTNVLNDWTRENFYTNTNWTYYATHADLAAEFNITLNDIKNPETLESLFICPEFVLSNLTTATEVQIIPYIIYKNQYGIDAQTELLTQLRLTTSLLDDFFMLPDFYYNKSSQTNPTQSEISIFDKKYTDIGAAWRVKTKMLLSSTNVDALINKGFSSTIKFGLQISVYAPDPTAITQASFCEIGILEQRIIDTAGENLYVSVSGEKLADASETNTVYTALRHILETYDKLTADKLDYGNLATKRNDWYVGRQLTEAKNSADYILELCQQSFVAGFQNRKGKIAFSAWRDRTDTPHTHDHTAIIRDSITNWEPVSIDNIFNCFTLKYSYNPGADSYFSAYQIKDVDDPADEPTDADLSAMWQVCRAAYLQYKTIKEFKIDLSFFNDRTRWYNSTDAMVGIGVDSSAWKFLENAVFWMTRQRRNVQYSLPMSAANVVIELCDPVNFRDTIYTNAAVDSSYIRGAIHTLEYDLKTDTVIVGSILDPADTIDADFGDIIETGSQTDEIVESGSRTDEYEETGN